MHLTVVILAGSNQLLPNPFLPDKNQELPNWPAVPCTHLGPLPEERQARTEEHPSVIFFFSKAEPRFGLSQMTNLFRKAITLDGNMKFGSWIVRMRSTSK